MKKALAVILIVIALVLTGCRNAGLNNAGVQTEGEESNRTENQTEVVPFTNQSDRFDITVYPTKIITEDGNKNIVYSVSVINKSEEAYKNFYVTIVMNEKLDQYIAAGVYPLPLSKIDLAAKSDPSPTEGEGKGVDINFQQLLSDEQFMDEADLDYKDILELGKSFELWLKWDGGEEKYMLESDVIDETSK